MEAIFLKILNMSITATWLIIAVVLLRVIFKKAPKSLRCILWGLVGIRLICPYSFESFLSLIPNAEPISKDIIYSHIPAVDSGISSVDKAINPVITENFTPQAGASVNPLQILTYILSIVWIVGILAMTIYCVVSYLRLYSRVKAGMNTQDNIYCCDGISTPFILGVFKPKIYLPSGMDSKYNDYVIAHEKAHIKRFDFLWKPLGFTLLSIYWFNPFIWVAYILLCRDIEMACDEAVIKNMDGKYKKEYSTALVECSLQQRKLIIACPLAFGEVSVKQRIKSVLNYKKPAFWVIITAIITCVVLTATFLTNPVSKNDTQNISNTKNSKLLTKNAAINQARSNLKDQITKYFNIENASAYAEKTKVDETSEVPIWVIVFEDKLYDHYLIAEIDSLSGECLGYTYKEAKEIKEINECNMWLNDYYGVDFKLLQKVKNPFSEYCEIIDNGDTYKYIIKDKKGNVLFSETYLRPGSITPVNNDILKFMMSSGPSISLQYTTYININTGEVSPTYNYVLCEFDNNVVSVSHDKHKYYLYVNNYMDFDLNSNKIFIDDANMNSVEPIQKATISEDKNTLTVTYYNKDNQEVSASFDLKNSFQPKVKPVEKKEPETTEPNTTPSTQQTEPSDISVVTEPATQPKPTEAITEPTQATEDTELDYPNTNSYTTNDKIDINIVDINLDSKVPYIKAQFNNKTSEFIEYGQSFGVYRKTNKGKVDCDTDDNRSFTLEAILTNDPTATREFKLQNYDLSKKGTYSLDFEFTLGGYGNKNTEHCTAHLEFEVK